MAGLLALGLLALSGCALPGSGKADRAPGPLETAAGLSSRCAVAEVEGESVDSRCYLYWLGRNCAYLAGELRSQGRQVQWNQGTQGETLGDAAKSAALRTAVLYTLLPKLAGEAGITLTAEDETALSQERQRRVENAGGEDAWARSLARWGLTEEDAASFARCHRLYQALFAQARQEGGALTAEAVAAYAEEQGLCTVAVLALPETDAAQLETLRAELSASASPVEDFAARAAERSTWPEPSVTLGTGEDALPEAAAAAAKALAPGQLSAVVTAEGQCFLFLGRDLDQDAAARALFDRQLTERVEGAEVKLLSPYEDIAPGVFYPALTAAQAAVETAASGTEETAGPAGDGTSNSETDGAAASAGAGDGSAAGASSGN